MDWDEITGEKKKFLVKAILDKDQVSLLGKEWVFAKRCYLEFKEDKLAVSGKDISFDAINDASLRIYRSAFFIQGCVLTLKGESFTHNFGMKYSGFWKSELPFPVKRTYERPPFLILRQGIIVILILFILYRIIHGTL